jgi:predicted nucleic acid-binding protein
MPRSARPYDHAADSVRCGHPIMPRFARTYDHAAIRAAVRSLVRRRWIPVTRYVIGPDVAMRLAHSEDMISGKHQVVAPTLLRSQLLSLLYQSGRRGEITKKDADRRLDYVRGLRIRLLGDRVLQNLAWKIADELGWPDTFDAEYVALTQLQADAFITLDTELGRAVRALVTVAPIEALS